MENSIYPEAAVLVIFGAGGDLTRRKLVPALYDLFLDHYYRSTAGRRPCIESHYRYLWIVCTKLEIASAWRFEIISRACCECQGQTSSQYADTCARVARKLLCTGWFNRAH